MFDKQEIESKVMEFLREKSKVAEPYTENMNFRDDLGLDSVDLTVLIFLLEDLLGATIADSELAHLTTIRSALDFLEAKKGVAP
ncbi:MAG: acyl carrier protein [Paenibacillaceae bacterium]|nr:acyl carrier protein [Paenibacillaceae bacterium]